MMISRSYSIVLLLVLASCTRLTATGTPKAGQGALPLVPATEVFVLPVASATPLGEVCTVAADALNLRAGPDAGAADVGELRKGAEVMILERRGAWARVSESTWVHAGWLLCR
jgi:uncharacterized protein YgiM (DUF1202 family)